MMEVNFRQAKLLCKNGFPQGRYQRITDGRSFVAFNGVHFPYESYDKPELHIVQKWFIEEYKIHIIPEFIPDVDSYGNVIGYHYDCNVSCIDISEGKCDTYYLENFSEYEIALSGGIDKALDIINCNNYVGGKK